MKATLEFAFYDQAKAFAVAWSRATTRGYTLSPRTATGGATVTLDGVTEAEKAWIDAYAAGMNSGK